MTYDFWDDFRKSTEFCYEQIRKRKAAGGPGWEGPRMKYTFIATVIDVQEKTSHQHVQGVGKEATFVSVSEGWRVSLATPISRIGLVFPDKPGFVVNDTVKITMEKVDG